MRFLTGKIFGKFKIIILGYKTQCLRHLQQIPNGLNSANLAEKKWDF